MEEEKSDSWSLLTHSDLPEKVGAGELLLQIRGDWLHRKATSEEKTVPRHNFIDEQEKFTSDIRQVSVDISEMVNWDSRVAALLYEVDNFCREKNIVWQAPELPPGLTRLLDLAMAIPPPKKEEKKVIPFLERWGEAGFSLYDSIVNVFVFVGEFCFALWRLVTFHSRMRFSDLKTEIRKAGIEAFGIIFLIGFLMGAILAYIGALLLEQFRAEIYVATLIGVGMLRMMGAVMAGIVMAGRTGAAYAAELGTMRVNEETDALESMGISTMDFLVLPRTLALSLMMPFLCVYSDIAGILGGYVIAVFNMGLTPTEYWTQLFTTTGSAHVYIGLITSWIFGILVAICGCYLGLKCKRSSEGVGQATTGAMVSSIVCLVVATFLITILTFALKV